jgi:Concanavalin A-like lectin/glucanases superfamily
MDMNDMKRLIAWALTGVLLAWATTFGAAAAEPPGLVMGVGMQAKGPAGNYTSTNPGLFGHLSPIPSDPNAPTSGPGKAGYGQSVNLDPTKLQYLDLSCRPDLYDAAGKCTANNAAARALQNVDRWTLAAWVFAKANPVVDERWEVAEKAGAYWLNIRSDTRKVRAGGIFGGKWVYLDSTAAVPLNKWTHVAATYDGTAVKVYVNGVLSGSTPATGPTFVNDNPLTVGAKNRRDLLPPTLEALFCGGIDDFRLYNRALTGAQVKAAMAAALP